MKAGPDGADGYQWMPIDPAFLDPALRLEQMDTQNVGGAIMFCGALGLFAELLLTDDELYWASSWAYLRWIEETWGFDRDKRIFTSPVISIARRPQGVRAARLDLRARRPDGVDLARPGLRSFAW